MFADRKQTRERFVKLSQLTSPRQTHLRAIVPVQEVELDRKRFQKTRPRAVESSEGITRLRGTTNERN